jgi:hypothetical protein
MTAQGIARVKKARPTPVSASAPSLAPAAVLFLMKTLPKVATEMALHVLAYNLTRVMNIVGIKPLISVLRA